MARHDDPRRIIAGDLLPVGRNSCQTSASLREHDLRCTLEISRWTGTFRNRSLFWPIFRPQKMNFTVPRALHARFTPLKPAAFPNREGLSLRPSVALRKVERLQESSNRVRQLHHGEPLGTDNGWLPAPIFLPGTSGRNTARRKSARSTRLALSDRKNPEA